MDQEYIVRRLTPTECARLQGFPDWWGKLDPVENPSEELIAEWIEIFETFAAATDGKPKTRNQVIKFLIGKDVKIIILWR